MTDYKNIREQRTPLLIGNWKMHKYHTQARSDLAQLGALTRVFAPEIQIGVAPVSLHLAELGRTRNKHVGIYAQNVHWETQGAYTGEHSTEMLADLALQGSLVAHSERRQMFGETNETAGKKINALLSQGLEAIYCVGETLEERDDGKLKEVLTRQIKEALHIAGMKGLGALTLRPGKNLFSIAYEPVWAIGTGKAATEIEAQEAHALIRRVLAEVTSTDFANKVRILYGGSVKPENILKFMGAPDVDGALVGGASLNPKTFEQLCQGVLGALHNKHY